MSTKVNFFGLRFGSLIMKCCKIFNLLFCIIIKEYMLYLGKAPHTHKTWLHVCFFLFLM